MQNKNKVLLAILFLIIFSGNIFSQTQPSPNTVKQSENFVSEDGGFTIALPSKLTRSSPVQPIKGITDGGTKLGWDSPQGAFVFSFTNYLKIPENPSKIFEELSNDVVTTFTDAKLMSKKTTSFLGNPALETTMHHKRGATMFYRYFFVEKRLFILTTMWKDGESGEMQLKILDSFKLIDEKFALTKQTEN